MLQRSCFWKHVIVSKRQKKRHKGRDDEEEDVRNCWITLRNREVTGTWNRKRYTAICGTIRTCRKSDSIMNEWWISLFSKSYSTLFILLLICYCLLIKFLFITNHFYSSPYPTIIKFVCLFVFWRDSFQWVMASSFTRFLDHTQRHTPQPLGLLRTSDQLVAETSTWQHTTLTTDRHSCLRWQSSPQSQQASPCPRWDSNPQSQQASPCPRWDSNPRS
jgi:hypothetical protein